MIGVVGTIFLLLIAGEVFQVNCERKFAEENNAVYDFVFKHASQIYTATERHIEEKNFQISGAEAKNVWMFIRHGARMLKNSEVPVLKRLDIVAKQIVESFQKETNIPFTQNGWKKLQEWNLESAQQQSKSQNMITSSGEAELESIAIKYKKRFSKLFVDKYSPNQFHILYTNEKRSKKSMESFFGKIFGKGVAEGIDGSINEDNEKILEAYRLYVQDKTLEQRPENVELKKFRESSAYIKMIEQIAEKFRLQANDYNQKQALVRNIFDMCRYEEAWYSNKSVWCSFFQTDDILMLQYDVDLYNFYEWGYGFDINDRIQCPTIRDMVTKLENGTVPVSAFFSHIPEISLHLVAMHVYRESQKLTSANYNAMQNRVWQNTKLVPFAANFAAVSYDNGQVKFFMNEELIKIGVNGALNLKDLKATFKQCF